MDLDTRVVCLHQLFKQKPVVHEYQIRPDGYGDCNNCTYDELNNKHCSGYVPVTMTYIEVLKAKTKEE